MEAKAPYIINIQKYSIHDGAGIRTTVFFKGCPLACLWCHNPESQNYGSELMLYHNRCTNCGKCISVCPNHAISIHNGIMETNRSLCTLCGLCPDECIHNVREFIGQQYTIKQLVFELEKDRQFYEDSGGGITLSGGEVLTQRNMDYIEDLCKTLHKKGHSVNIDTCGYAPYKNFKRLLPYIDTFLYDIKLMNEEEHKHFVGTGNRLILDNLQQLSTDNAKLNIRIPVILGVNDTDKFFLSVIAFLKEKVKVDKINLLPYHNTGKTKYKNLDLFYHDNLMNVPSQERMRELEHLFIENGFLNTKIGG